jgi:hypothetical protein
MYQVNAIYCLNYISQLLNRFSNYYVSFHKILLVLENENKKNLLKWEFTIFVDVVCYIVAFICYLK